jgi:hypothetical protein
VAPFAALFLVSVRALLAYLLEAGSERDEVRTRSVGVAPKHDVLPNRGTEFVKQVLSTLLVGVAHAKLVLQCREVRSERSNSLVLFLSSILIL